MNMTPTALEGVLIIEPKVFSDDRGFFYESFNQRKFDELVGRTVSFVQDNRSHSVRHVLRGMHYQIQQPQGKLVAVLQGAICDVVIDIRRHSPTFGQHIKVHLSAENKQMLWVPEGFAHGFLTLTETADISYKTTDYWAPEYERSIIWNDPGLGISWPTNMAPILSSKDRQGKLLADAECFE